MCAGMPPDAKGASAPARRARGPICAEVAEEVVRTGVAPSAAAGCAVKGAGGWKSEVGGDPDLYFDLASLTKPMTALAVAKSGLLDRRLGEVVPELATSAAGSAPIELLIAHRAGLVAHLPLFEGLVRGGAAAFAVRAAADAIREDARGPIPSGGFPPVYSDLGYILAGVALSRHAGTRDAGEAILRLVVEPMGLAPKVGTARELGAKGIDLVVRAAPTEYVAWRGGVVRGRVHDENAWMLTGEGGSGHAGMFGTIAGTLAFGVAVLDAVRAPELAWLVRERPGGTLRAGFDGKSAEGSSAGARFGPRSFGHLGFTGTSLWIDPDAGIVAVLLTNRVHPTRENLGIREARPRAHDALFARALELR
jgi:serine-type D-Ala-D-Ala carboxypeptidase